MEHRHARSAVDSALFSRETAGCSAPTGRNFVKIMVNAAGKGRPDAAKLTEVEGPTGIEQQLRACEMIFSGLLERPERDLEVDQHVFREDSQ